MNYRLKNKIKNIIIAAMTGIMVLSIGFQIVRSKIREDEDKFPDIQQVIDDVNANSNVKASGMLNPTLYGNYLIYPVTFKAGLVLDNKYDISLSSYAVYEFGLFSWKWEFKKFGGYVYGYDTRGNTGE